MGFLNVEKAHGQIEHCRLNCSAGSGERPRRCHQRGAAVAHTSTPADPRGGSAVAQRRFPPLAPLSSSMADGSPPPRTQSEAVAESEASDAVPGLAELVFEPPPAFESPMGNRGMTTDVSGAGTPGHPDGDRDSSRASVLATPNTVKVNRLEHRLVVADGALAQRKRNLENNQRGSVSPVRITADEDEWAARVAAIESDRGPGSPVAEDGSPKSPKWSRDTAPSVLNAAMGSVLDLTEEQARVRRSSSPVLGETSLAGGEQSSLNLSAKPAFIAGSSMAADSMAASSRAGSPTKLTDTERRERRQRREKKRHEKEAANTRKLHAARQVANQMKDERRDYKAGVRLERRRTMAATHIGGGGHQASNGGMGGVGLGSSMGGPMMQDDDFVARRRSDGEFNQSHGVVSPSPSPLPGGFDGNLSHSGHSLNVRHLPGGPKRRHQSRGLAPLTGQHRALSPIQRRAMSQSATHSLSGTDPIGETAGLGENDQKARADAAAMEKRLHAKQHIARKLETHEQHQVMQSQERSIRAEARDKEHAEKKAKLASLEKELAMQGAARRDDFAAKEAEYWKLRKKQEAVGRSKGRGKFLANQEQRKQRLHHKWQSNEEVFVANTTKLQQRFPAACE